MSEATPPAGDPHPLLPLLRSASRERLAILLGVIGALGLCLYWVRDVAAPVFEALALAYVLAPVVDRLERRRVPRLVAVIALIIGLLVVGLGIIAIVVPALFEQLSALMTRLPGYLTVGGRWISKNLRVQVPTDASAFFQQAKNALGPDALGTASTYVGKLIAGSAGAIGGLANALLVLLLLFFFLKDWHALPRALRLLPEPMQGPVAAKLAQIDRSLAAYVRAVSIVATTLAAYYSVALSAIGVPLGLSIGVLAGYAYVVPFMSSVVGISLSVLFSLLEFSGFGQVVGIFVIFMAGNLLESFFLTPRIVGDKLGLSPVVVILSVLTGGSLFGFVGVLIALPTAAIINVVGSDLLALWRTSELYRTGLAGGDSKP